MIQDIKQLNKPIKENHEFKALLLVLLDKSYNLVI